MAETHTDKRPLSPHLQIYRWTLPFLMSGFHRVTGFVLYFGFALVSWWLIAAASGPSAYANVQWFFGTFIGRLVLLGYTISTLARTQMQALQLTFFFFLPSIMLSGFMFPYRGMPGWAQTFGEIFPLTHFLRITRAVMLKGAELPAVASEIGWLVFFVALFAGVALVRFRRTLD